MVYADSHAHLIDYSPDRLKSIIELMQKNHVDFALAVGVNLDSSEGTIGLAKIHSSVKAAVGIHPWFARKPNADMRRRFDRLAASKYVRAVGEIGLDYAPPQPGAGPPEGKPPGEPSPGTGKMEFPPGMPPLPEAPAPPEDQKELFRFELATALKYGLPVNVHCHGGAHQDMMVILKKEVPSGLKGIAHGFEGDLKMLRDWLELDFYIALGTRGVTEEPLAGLEDIVQAIPPDRLVFETDANPVMSPENGPVDVIPIVQKVASIKGTSAEELGNATTANLKHLLKL